ncbi:CsiV family protein [Pseudomonas sp. NW5]|uniref:CsiV family protein n=1 Tax=Pseudomonas sp. NW5 TaxID=2934934 RepID=UPI0020210AAB|nr:CsiV family protein [Pseudomonas sp. NW5]MCL7461657.1 peptidoglycan binding protein CsiV [Pseudomonas sp. NW5]
MRRLLSPLCLALWLIAPNALAETLYHLELLVFRQAPPLLASQPPGEDWSAGVAPIAKLDQRTAVLRDQAAQLGEHLGPVLLQQAWQQRLGEGASRVRFGAGPTRDGHQTVEGILSLEQGRSRYPQLTLELWVNHFDAEGQLQSSERLRQKQRLLPGQLTYIDHPSLGALVRARLP